MPDKIINKIMGGVVLLMLVGIAYGVSISCPECYVGDCRCISDCPLGAGSLDVFETQCAGSPAFSYTISSGEVWWPPPKETTYYMMALCDEGGKTSCIAVKVGSASTTTTIPTTTTIKRPKPPKPTPRTTTTTSSTSTTVTSTTSSSTTTSMNATTSSTTISTTTTTTKPTTTTTTTILVCNNNTICESELNREENYINCPMDCPSGGQDNYCDGVGEGICDPDCGRMQDPDCICNNNITCEVGIENHLNCPMDCPSGGQDDYCDGLEDGICDPDCAVDEDPDCGKKDAFQYTYYLMFLVPLIIICAIAVVA
ncbi:MAG: hypothetical protein KAU03_00890, partial [Candidatus Altiarchaeales archaeon]|nr:hypothetical protein [Candidatus Altiarchaeales archaeon]